MRSSKFNYKNRKRWRIGILPRSEGVRVSARTVGNRKVDSTIKIPSKTFTN
jgi:hypothetical protein